jgi:hypothetical protein
VSLRRTAAAVALGLLGLAHLGAATDPAKPTYAYEDRGLLGWKAHVRVELLTPEKKATTEKGLLLVVKQLEDVEKLVPAKALAQLKKIPLWFSPPYAGKDAGAAYHPGAKWLKDNGRDPAMAKGVEFSNIDKLDKEVLRMPLLTLHELAHGYHDLVLGFKQPEIKACYDRAVANGSYDHVSRRDWKGKITENVKAYAMSNEREFFAETTEAYFGTNDFFPYNRAELEKHDPETVKVLRKVWGVE